MNVSTLQPRLQAILFCAIGLMAAATVYVSALISQQQRALEEAAHYDVAFSAGQAANEFFRFNNAIANLFVTNSEDARDEAELRFEILYSRQETLSSGAFLTFIEDIPDAERAVDGLRATIRQVEPLVGRLGEPGMPMQVQEAIAELAPLMVSMAAAANNYGAGLVAQSQGKIISLHWLFSAITAALIAAGFLLIVLLIWSKRLLGQVHSELLVTAGDLEDQTLNLKRQNLLFDAAINNMSQGLCMFGAGGELIVSNRRFAELFKLPPPEAGEIATLDDVVDKCSENEIATPERLERMFGAPNADEGDAPDCGFVEEVDNGRVMSINRQHISGGGWVITQEDVTKRHRAEERLAYLAANDTLTGLSNRHSFRESLQEAIDGMTRNGESAAVICFDLDRFKNVNDTLGHRYGDLLLQVVAERTQKLVRKGDVVARFGGDEFAVLLKGLVNSDRAVNFTRRLIEALTETHDLEGHKVIVGVSAGITMVNGEINDADTTIRNADTALYKAKATGGNDYQAFDGGMDVGLQARRTIELDLWNAFERGEFELVYQPQINLLDYRINGVEALLRWKHPERGYVSPAEFVPVAEDIGLIEPLGAWVLHKACSEVASWPKPVKVAVNLSPVQFTRGDLITTLKSVLEATGLEPEQLELEITESLFLQENAAVSAMLQQLREMKIGFALDDFGTGYSSLSYIRRFPIDKIKIDKSFVDDIAVDQESLAIVRAVTTLGHALNISTTAEGVETVEQMRLLHLAGCNEGQGFLFSRPLPATEMIDLLSEPASFKRITG